jgi:phosphate transport system permease protein
MSATSRSRSDRTSSAKIALTPPEVPEPRADEPTPSSVFRAPEWRKAPPRWHWVAETTIKVVAMAAIIAIVLIFSFLVIESLPLFTSKEVHAEVTPSSMWWKYVWDGGLPRWSWQPASTVPKYSIVPLLIGSLKVTLVSVLVGAPLGILAAIFSSQMAPRWLREILKPTIELLAGIPSVVIGVFALLTMATWFQRAFGFEHRLNALAAGCALAITIVPLVFTIAEDALSAVPKAFADASLALGATRGYTIRRVIVPAAIPGIAAGVVLGFGRAIGETMIVVMASGNAAIAKWDLGLSTRTVTATIAQEMAEVVHGSPHYVVLFSLGAILLVFTLITNIAAQRIVEHFRKKRGGS